MAARNAPVVSSVGVRNGMWMYFSPASVAAARLPSMFAPFSPAVRKLMTEAKPRSLSAGIAEAGVAPAQATVASTRV